MIDLVFTGSKRFLRPNESDVLIISPQNNEVVQPKFRRFTAQMVALPHYSAQLIYPSDALDRFPQKYAKFYPKLRIIKEPSVLNISDTFALIFRLNTPVAVFIGAHTGDVSCFF